MENIIYLSFAQSQGIDWPTLKQNVSAVMIRTGQSTFEDTLFRSHYAGGVGAHIPLGLWHFYQPNMAAQPQVDNFLRIYNSLEYKPKVIAVDVENIRYFDVATGQYVNVQPPSRQYNNDQLSYWCRTVKAATSGKVGIYTRKDYFEQWTIESTDWYQYWMWIAAWYNYTGVVKPSLPWHWPTYKIHQYEGGTGRIDGVTGPVCREYFNGTHQELIDFFEPPWGEDNPPEQPPGELESRVTQIEAWIKSFKG